MIPACNDLEETTVAANYDDFNEEDLYDQFPAGAGSDAGPSDGFNTLVRLNDPDLFTPEAREQPAIRAFLDAPFSVTYAQFKSSHREAEYFLHKPHKSMTGGVDGIEGHVQGMPPDAQIATLVINHDRSLAKRIMRSITIEDGAQAGQIIHKENPDG